MDEAAVRRGFLYLQLQQTFGGKVGFRGWAGAEGTPVSRTPGMMEPRVGAFRGAASPPHRPACSLLGSGALSGLSVEVGGSEASLTPAVGAGGDLSLPALGRAGNELALPGSVAPFPPPGWLLGSLS